MGWQPGQAYWDDLRARVLSAVVRGGRSYEIAPLFEVSVSSIYKALARRKVLGIETALPKRGRPGRKLDSHVDAQGATSPTNSREPHMDQVICGILGWGDCARKCVTIIARGLIRPDNTSGAVVVERFRGRLSKVFDKTQVSSAIGGFDFSELPNGDSKDHCRPPFHGLTLGVSPAPDSYFNEIARPLRSAFANSPTSLPESFSTAPFSLVSMIARAPLPTASPAPAAP